MAKSYGQLFEKIAAPENLAAALKRAAKGKRARSVVQGFLKNSEVELALLRSELLDGTYRPRPVTQFRIMDPKPRTITCADFRDRVVHHALCAVISPFLENRFIDDSFACRIGKGSHRAGLVPHGNVPGGFRGNWVARVSGNKYTLVMTRVIRGGGC